MPGVVTVTQGKLRGVWRGDVWSFSGIPYAQAPLGDLRWRPPQPPPIVAGIRDASAFGPIAPQNGAAPGITGPADPEWSEAQSEDCLSLNVWTPELPGAPGAPGRGRPVMVFVHGGGFTSGSGSVFLYRGGSLARNGDAVVVTINYRLGALGFLGHRGLAEADGSTGNWGLHDQVAALRWVRANIGVFGGDPANVTVFGESAGGFSIASCSAPAAAGLFRRAVVQSGAAHVHTLEEAARTAEQLAGVLGLASCDRSVARRVPAAELVAATDELGAPPRPGLAPARVPARRRRHLPARDPLSAVAAVGGRYRPADRDQSRRADLLRAGDPDLLALDEEGCAVRRLPCPTSRRARCSRPTALLAAPARTGDAVDIWVAAGTDIVFRWPSLQLAAAHAARGTRRPTSTSSSGSRPRSAASSARATRSSSRSSSARCTVRSCRCSRAAARPSGSRRTCSGRGSPSPHRGTPGTRASARGALGPGRATMVFGGHTRLVEAPRDEELAVLERHRPLVSGVPG